MVIDCPNCNKKFNIDQSLIPLNGRLLQCGSCNHKWFFKINVIEKNNEDEIKIKTKKNLHINTDTAIKSSHKKNNFKTEKIISKNVKDYKKINYLNILLVIILSITAFILVLDTFKNQLTTIFPNIEFLLNNLYQSIQDIKLFILDLTK